MKDRQPAPTASIFDGWYGALYDQTVQNRRLARIGAAAVWGFDLQRVYRLMAEAIACEPGQVVLDVPTGGGVTFAAGAPDTHGLLVGLDRSRRMLRRALARKPSAGLDRHLVLLQSDAARLPIGSRSVDRVACFNSLHCMPRALHPLALAEFRRVLKPGGQLLGTTLVADPSGPWQTSIHAARLAGMFTPPSQRSLAAAARAAGFGSWRQDLSGALLFFGGE